MSKNTYSKKLIYEAEKSREASLIGRDISPLPCIVNPLRRIGCKESLERFCLTYMSDVFIKPFGKIHRQLINSLEKCVKNGESQAVALPRGYGKSSLVTASVIWGIVYGYRRYVVLIAASQKESRRLCENIKRFLLNPSGNFYEDFPEVSYPITLLRSSPNRSRGQVFEGEPTNISLKSDGLRFPTIRGSVSSGAVLSCFGATSAIRGQQEHIQGKIVRPDLCICDDLQKGNTDAFSFHQVSKLEEQIATSISGLSDSAKKLPIIITGTCIAPDDLMSRYLNHELYPWYNGIKGGVLISMPTNMEAWRQYRNIFYEQGQEEANRFYLEHQKELDEGAEVAWEEDYDASIYPNALVQNMTSWAMNERAFFSERMNQPLQQEGSLALVPPRVIMSKLNGLEEGVCPFNTFRIVASVDIHSDILYYLVLAVDSHSFKTSVIEYGTFPEQNRNYFHKGDGGLRTLTTEFNASPNVSLKMGIEVLLADLIKRHYPEQDTETILGVSRVFVDSRWKPELVEQALSAVRSSIIVPSLGVSIKATNKPMSRWRTDKGRRKLYYHCAEEKIEGRRYRAVMIDSNFWKAEVHTRLALNPDEDGSISLYGNEAETHRMLAEHLNAESTSLVSSGENEVQEFQTKPGKPDNHLFDCLSYALCCASTLSGVAIDGIEKSKKRKVRADD